MCQFDTLVFVIAKGSTGVFDWVYELCVGWMTGVRVDFLAISEDLVVGFYCFDR